VLCDGTKRQAEEMRQELAQFLMTTLKLELSIEKTQITHVSRGFIFLGFQIERTTGRGGKPVPKVRIPDTALRRIRHKIEQVLAPATCQASVRAKIIALNRIIRGWCEYYRSTASPGVYFRRLNYVVFWKMAHWLGRKFKLSMPRVMRRFLRHNSFATKKARLKMPSEFTTKWYRLRTIPNPYLSAQPRLHREGDAVFGRSLDRGRGEARECGLTRTAVRARQRPVWLVWLVCSVERIPHGSHQAPTSVQTTCRSRRFGEPPSPPQMSLS
jgi:hypothetical protein